MANNKLLLIMQFAGMQCLAFSFSIIFTICILHEASLSHKGYISASNQHLHYQLLFFSCCFTLNASLGAFQRAYIVANAIQPDTDPKLPFQRYSKLAKIVILSPGLVISQQSNEIYHSIQRPTHSTQLFRMNSTSGSGISCVVLTTFHIR